LLLVNQINKTNGLDSTYKICADAYSLSIFTCVNKYSMTEVLAICFHTEEKTENFQFALDWYIRAGFISPEIIFTDRSNALVAIKSAWLVKSKSLKHFWCIYHIFRNIQEYIGIVYYYKFDSQLINRPNII